ncbi:MAG TPA: glutamine--fructose-6-phosphate transaminase (isomerizing), partial [Myxococcales bacterium]
YDSAGIAILMGDGRVEIRRAKGKLDELQKLLVTEPLEGKIGIGHTRWATHGRPSAENAHPHKAGPVAVIHNGIIENYVELRAALLKRGHKLSSETDTEAISHLIEEKVKAGAGLADAVRRTVTELRGSFSIVVLSETEPGKLVAAKTATPLVLGFGEGENFVASDIPALLEHTRDFVYMEEGDLALLTPEKVMVFDRLGAEVHRPLRRIDWTPMMAEKGGHKHFMHKEIWEQPRAVADTIRGRVLLSEGDVHLEGWNLSAERVASLTRITMLACGTSWHSGLAGKFMIEKLARIPVDVELASEFRYRDPLVDGQQLAIAISQSGETLDTIAAMREAKSRGAPTMTICNVMGSAMTREADLTLLTNAGPEIGVASTKAFTTQLAALYLLAVKLGRMRGTLNVSQAQQHLTHLTEIPKMIEDVLQCESSVKEIAKHFHMANDFLFLGRGPMHPVALEGALKLKEISYVHAEGYAGGEMKHGPIALIDERMPVVVMAPKQPALPYEKIIGNVQEVKARGGQVISLVDEDDELVRGLSDYVITMPPACALLAPLIAVVPLQLLAYHIADLRGTDVDQPRNLAKSVTVE